jgi:hypothetical protein
MLSDASLLAVSSGGFRPYVDIRNGRRVRVDDDAEYLFGGSFRDGRSLAISAMVERLLSQHLGNPSII